MKRRSFFKKISAIAAAVAIAPEIAFATKLPIQHLQAVRFMNISSTQKMVEFAKQAGNEKLWILSNQEFSLMLKRHNQQDSNC